MWNKPSQNKLAKIPRLYETEHTPLKEKIIHLHFLIAASDWYVVEYDGDDIFWGFAILNGDYDNAEWGYIPFSELKAINVRGFEVDCDLFWRPCPAREVEKICQGSRHWSSD